MTNLLYHYLFESLGASQLHHLNPQASFISWTIYPFALKTKLKILRRNYNDQLLDLKTFHSLKSGLSLKILSHPGHGQKASEATGLMCVMCH